MRPRNPLLLRPLLRPHKLPPITTTPTVKLRPFHLPSLSSFTNPLSPNPPPPRTLTATRNLPFPPEPLFRTIADIDSYAQFLPFLTASTVTARDVKTGYPTSAFLTVGYGPLKETFVSRVECDAALWTVGARSGRRAAEDGAAEAGDGGLFEFLDTLWKLRAGKDGVVVNGGGGRGAGETRVELEVRFQFRSALHAALMGAVEDQVAGMMIEAFEKRVRELERARMG
ncbi:hypothetical protein BDBG_07377 [Blastomyces gilchristii SLH14081]|uniref:Coenzyme Q-binding protein COQ10 START domain-containing protein n=1 Tax=Blastomyces gilchristii (strain SLH14081) TaxID=559298 RepID=A0A179UV19_BLAGS|nr:uncharacterized protein BDBG_07377 [Blastomyces gilchristii SLH14081]OAT11966.1 hypothetical protein BDBG_07377 [Blastomyces gilchristii SLH14081]